MKTSALILVIVLAVGALVTWRVLSRVGGGVQIARAQTTSPSAEDSSGMASLYEMETTTLEGQPAPLKQYEGKVALVVNVASKCGFTPQYKGLEALYEEKKDQGLVLLGFPSSDFLNQEPGSPEEIRAFCTKNYGVTFPLFSKRHVKGEEKDAIYTFLTRELEEPSWNFTKYLVDRQGHVRYRFAPKTTPEDKELRAKIDEILAEVRTAHPGK